MTHKTARDGFAQSAERGDYNAPPGLTPKRSKPNGC